MRNYKTPERSDQLDRCEVTVDYLIQHHNILLNLFHLSILVKDLWENDLSCMFNTNVLIVSRRFLIIRGRYLT